jgi:uncharacterized membrane protein
MSVVAFGLILSFLWGVLPVVHKAVLSTLNHRVVLVMSGVIYFATLLVYTAWNWKVLRKEGKKITVKHVAWLSAGTIGCTFLGSIIYYYLISEYDSHIVTAISYSSPFFALILAWLFLKEDVSVMGAVGVLLIVAGVVAIGFNARSAARHK